MLHTLQLVNVFDMEQVRRSPAALILVGIVAAAMIIFILMAIPKSWEEATTRNPDGSYSLSKEWAETIEQKKRKN